MTQQARPTGESLAQLLKEKTHLVTSKVIESYFLWFLRGKRNCNLFSLILAVRVHRITSTEIISNYKEIMWQFHTEYYNIYVQAIIILSTSGFTNSTDDYNRKLFYQGVPVGTTWLTRVECSQDGIHR